MNVARAKCAFACTETEVLSVVEHQIRFCELGEFSRGKMGLKIMTPQRRTPVAITHTGFNNYNEVGKSFSLMVRLDYRLVAESLILVFRIPVASPIMFRRDVTMNGFVMQ